MKILITGAHNTPALAVWKALKKSGYEDFLYVGQRKSMIGAKNYGIDFEVAQKNGIPFQNIFAGKFRKDVSKDSFIWWLRIPIGFVHALSILLRYRPNIIITFGSHVGVPITIVGRLLRIQVLHHQQPIVIGTADQIIRKYANISCYSWKETEKHMPAGSKPKKFVFTGNPLRPEITTPQAVDFGFAEKRPLLLVVGGNQGAHIINKNIKAIVKRLVENYNVLHQTGKSTTTNDFETHKDLAKEINASGVKYQVKDYLFAEEMGAAEQQADLIVSRSGANFCYEFVALGKPCILIPIPWAIRNEQMLNAKMLKKIGLASIIEQKNLTPETLSIAIKKKFRQISLPSMAKAKEKAKEVVKFDATENIVKQVEKLLKRKIRQ